MYLSLDDFTQTLSKVDKIARTSEGENADENANNKFEELSRMPESEQDFLTQATTLFVSSGIENTPIGESVTLEAFGCGYLCQWFYYHTCDGRHMLIFRTSNSYRYSFSGREINEVPRSFGINP